MPRSLPSESGTVSTDASAARDSDEPALDLVGLPPTFILPTHLSQSTLHELEEQLLSFRAPLVHAAKDARLLIGRLVSRKRAEFEIRCLGLRTSHVHVPEKHNKAIRRAESPPNKRRKIDGGGGNVDIGIDMENDDSPTQPRKTTQSLGKNDTIQQEEYPQNDPRHSTDTASSAFDLSDTEHIIKVISLNWLLDSVAVKKVLPFGSYTIHEATLLLETDKALWSVKQDNTMTSASNRKVGAPNVLQVREDMPASVEREREHSFRPTDQQRVPKGSTQAKRLPPNLVHQSTSEFEDAREAGKAEMPMWVMQGKKYACQRRSPPHSPNEEFINQLKKIRHARILQSDEIGVRAYSTSIAAIASYPYPLNSSKEILALPGCSSKIAHLFYEWKSRGFIQQVKEIEEDEYLKIVGIFYEIWSVGAATARDFYLKKGWRDLDDIVEFGWDSLTFTQKVGVKYYEEFRQRIPRAEVEDIAKTVTEHARRVRHQEIECCIVGGYRRGKPESGDVDVILSHRQPEMTLNLIQEVIKSLEEHDLVTHTLIMGTSSSRRGQEPLPFRSAEKIRPGFDTLDKANVVWRSTPNSASSISGSCPHRRVDIIIAPWFSVGCAVLVCKLSNF